MGIGQNIKEIRKSKGMTQKQLGNLLGVSQAAIGQFENDKANLTMETINKIAAALNVDPFSLYSFEMASDAIEVSQNEKTLLNCYRRLNSDGQKMAIELMNLLTKIQEDQNTAYGGNPPVPKAAHEGENVDFTSEGHQADEE